MPRGVKKAMDYDTEMAKIDAMIKKQSEVLSKLKAEKKALQDKKNEADLRALQGLILNEGMTVAEIADIVKKSKK